MSEKRAANPTIRPASDKPQRWSQRVTQTSNALDLAPGVFTWENPQDIAESLKASAEGSTRCKASPFKSAMSMLSFYINRAGSELSDDQRARLQAAKVELRALFGRPPGKGSKRAV